MEDKILEKLKNIEDRVAKLENTKREKKQEIGPRNSTIDPSLMKVGTMAYVGRYETENTGSTFGADCINIDSLLNTNSFEMAKVIDAFSSEERIRIIKELMKSRMTGRQLMEKLNFSTTGKLYHHLSFLEKIGVIKKYDSETFTISGRYISCVLLIFAGVEKIIRNSPNT